MPDAHAIFSPSGAHRWMVCPGSHLAEKSVEDTRDKIHSAEGTAAHEIREKCLRKGTLPEKYHGKKITADGFEFECDDEMIEALTPGIERIRELGGKLFVEKRVSLKRWIKDCWGTMDAGIIMPRMIEVNDLKYGKRAAVTPKGNKQALTYGLGFYDDFIRKTKHAEKIQKVRIVIDQPRNVAGGGEWVTTVAKLQKHGKQLQKAQKRALAKRPAFNPGDDQCQFCKVKASCRALSDFTTATMSARFGDLDLEDPDAVLEPDHLLTRLEQARIARHASLMKKHIDAVYAQVMEDAVAGRADPSVKAVEGRAAAKSWVNEPKAAEFVLGKLAVADAYTRKIITPTQFLDLVDLDKKGAKQFDVLKKQGNPSLKLVGADHPKAAVSRLDKFSDLDAVGEE
jgi:hypothetical protein